MLLIFLITGSFSALWAVNNDTDNQSLLEYKLINNKELSVRHANGSIEGKVVIAAGMARFSSNDRRVATVFERADARMYENKKMLKGIKD